MNLALYSDQIIPANRAVDAVLCGMLPTHARIGYVPSAIDPERRYFRSREAYYQGLGLRLEVFHDPELGEEDSLGELFSCDAVHLSGGDTAHFLGRLHRAGMLAALRTYAADGGVLIGVSAGAILMTPTIAVDVIFSGGNARADAVEGALNLIAFEFFPHLDQDPRYLPALREYSLHNGRTIIACDDGGGLVVRGDQLQTIGGVVEVKDGAERPLEPAILSLADLCRR